MRQTRTLPLLESVIVTVPSSHWTTMTVLLFSVAQFGVVECANGMKNSEKSNVSLFVMDASCLLF
ncbi:hypothetical protein PC510_002444 [Escherichia coli]|uniref:hypothetical protein n=1 Tax=Escherichia coli TaxID=562 RepID=UPI001080546C|nr:hypothetical protein [Escherichia coli]MED9195589.1 hypothetical protein [Escherichia marmotae]EIS6464753.1 hypothetical protein [Escherichia coli]EKI3095216.1 hypothetical protein [Escherichia coli]MED9497966.1 hypothetical protein [Escherichia marmotae]TGH01656.1 hypothetical protein E5S62_02015 [Escherichia coli]